MIPRRSDLTPVAFASTLKLRSIKEDPMTMTSWTANDSLLVSPALALAALIGCFVYARWDRVRHARVLVPVRVQSKRRPGGGIGV